jgi:arabinan endo-1,5-alpha-L-arabinosidase
MSNKIRFMSLLAALCMGVAGAQTAYVSPLTGSLSGQDYSKVMKDSNTYYVYYTGNLIPYKTSPNRIAWTSGGTALAAAPAWFKTYVAGAGTDVWAPDIDYRSGQYWLYYAVSTFGSNVSVIGLATNTTLNPASANYKWVDRGAVIASVAADSFNCIDPSTSVDAHGSWWMSFGSFWTGIKLVRLDSISGKRSSTDTAIYSIANRTGGTTAIEGSFIFHYGSYYYLFVSWDKCCDGVSSTYNIRFGRSAAITGPYVDMAGVAMMSGGGTLLDTSDSRWKGPGTGGVFVDNDTVFLSLHAYDANNGGTATLQIRPLYFGTGWPSFTPSAGVRDQPSATPLPQNPASEISVCSGDRFAIPPQFRGRVVSVSIYALNGTLEKTLQTLRASLSLKRDAGISGGTHVVRCSPAQ